MLVLIINLISSILLAKKYTKYAFIGFLASFISIFLSNSFIVNIALFFSSITVFSVFFIYYFSLQKAKK